MLKIKVTAPDPKQRSFEDLISKVTSGGVIDLEALESMEFTWQGRKHDVTLGPCSCGSTHTSEEGLEIW